jgi:hypothetical protein
MENKTTEMILDEARELNVIRCPVCHKAMIALTDPHPEMTGWLRCEHNHKTTYLHGVPVQTTKNGTILWKAS